MNDLFTFSKRSFFPQSVSILPIFCNEFSKAINFRDNFAITLISHCQALWLVKKPRVIFSTNQKQKDKILNKKNQTHKIIDRSSIAWGISSAWSRVRMFDLSFDWLILLIVSLVIGQNYCFVLGTKPI